MSKTIGVGCLTGTILAAVGLWSSSAESATVTIGPNQEILVDGEPFLPIMQWLQSSSRIAHQKDLGINTFVGNGGSNTSQEYLDECAAQGVWGVMSPGDMTVATHGSLLGWIFGDEPDLESNQVEPAAVLAEYQSIKTTDPNHVTFLTLTARFYSEFDPPPWMGGDRGRYHEYPNATDVVGYDLYPIYGWCRTDWLYRTGDSHAELVSTYAPNMPTYQWIECSRTSGQWCDLAERAPDDGPYAEEVRNQIWQAIANGATSVGYFTHSWECPGYTQFCLSAEQEAELQRTNEQLTALTRPILAPRYGGSLDVTASGQAEVDWIAKQHDGQVHIFAVNVDRQSTDATFTLSDIDPDATVEVVDETRTIQVSAGSFTDTFDPLEVHIYAVDLPAGSGGGGAAGVGGSGAGSASGGGGATPQPPAAAPSSDEDCDCTAPGRSPTRAAWWSMALLGALLARRRRRLPSRSGEPTGTSRR